MSAKKLTDKPIVSVRPYACCIRWKDTAISALYDIVTAESAAAALKTARRRDINKDIVSEVALGLGTVWAEPITHPDVQAPLQAAADRYEKTVAEIIGDSNLYDLQAERERLARRYRRRAQKAKRKQGKSTALTAVPSEAPAAPAPAPAVEVSLAEAPRAPATTPAKASGRLGAAVRAVAQAVGLSEAPATPAPVVKPVVAAETPVQSAQKAADADLRDRIAPFVTRADDGQTKLGATFIGETRDVTHAFNRAAVIARILRDSGRSVSAPNVAEVAAAKGYLDAAATLVIDLAPAAPSAPAEAPAKAKAAPKAAAKRVAPARRKVRKGTRK